MSPREKQRIQEIVERMLATGETDRQTIINEVAARVSVDVEEMRRVYFDKRVSLAVASIVDEVGERLAFPGRSEDGSRAVFHLEHSHDARAMYRSGIRLRSVGAKMIRAGDRLTTRAIQLGLFAGDQVAA